MSLWSTLPPGEQVVTEPAGDVDLALARGSPRSRTSGPTWPPTGGPGAGPGPAAWAPARSAWSSSRCSGS